MKKRIEPYNAEIADDMQYMYQSLNEKDRRHYAAIEAKKLGHGGIAYIARLFEISERTIREGLAEFPKKTS
jgi:hypothetical protein